uniref:Transmembrane protein n=1 Tax=Echinococcus granulosus TaxID=6210 RepID=A0A068X400_ECHGR|nr:hypothetical protein EgrG_002049500 [Echinococcus granulosus]
MELSYLCRHHMGIVWLEAIIIRDPLTVDQAVRCLPPHEQAHAAVFFRIFAEGKHKMLRKRLLLSVDQAVRCLPPHEQAHAAVFFRIFAEGVWAWFVVMTRLDIMFVAGVSIVVGILQWSSGLLLSVVVAAPLVYSPPLTFSFGSDEHHSKL